MISGGGSRAARLTVMPSDAVASVYELSQDRSYWIGRASDADICLTDPSASRQHAQLSYSNDGWKIADSNSLNGVHLNGEKVEKSLLPDDGWLRFGDVYCHFEVVSVDDFSPLIDAPLTRWHRNDRQRHFSRNLDLPSLARDIMVEVVRMLKLERAYLLVAGEQDEWTVLHALDQRGERLTLSRFSGSTTALNRCVTRREPVIVHDISPSNWLMAQASVMDAGLRAVLAFPMLANDDLLGVIYVDSRSPGATVTELDLAVLKNLAGQAALPLWLARMDTQIRQLKGDLALKQAVGPQK